MIKRILASLMLVVLTFSAVPLSVSAFDIFPNNAVKCSGEANGSAVCESKTRGDDDPIAGPNGMLADITNILAVVAGMAAVIVLVVSGIRYVTSDGDAGNVKSAKHTAQYALIGLIVIVVARALISFVILELG
jgi:Type IV secretion system pilin